MLRVVNLSVAYGELMALRNINLSIGSGLTAVVGPNGSGKTTLLKALAGLMQYEGNILLDGKPLSLLNPATQRRLVTYIPPYVQAMPDMNIGDVLLVGEGIDMGRLEYYVKMLDVDGLLERRIWEVSSGELQRSLIARGLSRNSLIYCVDEPISHTDVKYQLRILRELKEISVRDKYVLVASNQLNPVLSFADRVIALRKGDIYFSGDLEEFLNEGLIRGLYGVRVRIVRIGSLIDVVPVAD